MDWSKQEPMRTKWGKFFLMFFRCKCWKRPTLELDNRKSFPEVGGTTRTKSIAVAVLFLNRELFCFLPWNWEREKFYFPREKARISSHDVCIVTLAVWCVGERKTITGHIWGETFLGRISPSLTWFCWTLEPRFADAFWDGCRVHNWDVSGQQLDTVWVCCDTLNGLVQNWSNGVAVLFQTDTLFFLKNKLLTCPKLIIFFSIITKKSYFDPISPTSMIDGKLPSREISSSIVEIQFP